MRRLPVVILSLILVVVLIAGCGTNAKNPIIEEDENPSEHNSDLAEAEDLPSKVETDGANPVDGDLENPEATFIIDEPKEGQLVESGKELVIKGKTKARNFKIEVEDGHNILGEASIQLEKEPAGLKELETSIKLESHTSPSGTIIFVLEGEDGKRQEDFMLPVKFE